MGERQRRFINAISERWRIDDAKRIRLGRRVDPALCNEIIGPEAEAVELYPAESRLVDGANQYHLWVIENFRFPFGFNTRKISEGNACGVKQRPFEPGFRPDDCVQLTEESYLKELQQELEKAQVAKEQIDGFRIVRRLGVGSNRCADCREATEPDDLFHFEGVPAMYCEACYLTRKEAILGPSRREFPQKRNED